MRARPKQRLVERFQDAGYAGPAGTAGDVNGDGYADVILSAYRYDGGQTDEGRVYLYHGSVEGLSLAEDWSAEGEQSDARFGREASAAGDVNGDGYADIIVGAHQYSNDQTTEGGAFLYYGNGGDGLDLLPRQVRGDGATPIAPLGLSGSTTGVQLRLLAHMPLGRDKVKLEWQVAPVGTLFSSTVSSIISGTSSTWIDVLPGGTSITQNVTGLTQTTAYHWRVRLRYRPGNRLGQAASRWIHVPWNGWNETDFRTGTAEESIAGLAVSNDSPTVLGDGTTLTATVTSGTNVSYTWAFGDGNTDNGAVVTHTYPSAITYTAIVTASNSVNVLTATTRVTITGAADFTTRVITYVYDALNRLTGAEYSTGESYEYAYDAVGNREVMTTTAGTTTYQYDDANRLTTVGDVSYTWDDAGNLTHDGVFTYTWNGAGRLVQAQNVTATLVYTYNGDGVRVAQEVSTSAGTTVTEWVQTLASHCTSYNRLSNFDCGLPQVLVESTSGETTLYVYGLSRLAQAKGNDTEWFLSDALGSVRQLIDDSGDITLARDYTPYGQPLSESGTGSSGYAFTGEQWDADVELLFLRARHYDPETGRFLSEDQWPGNVYKSATLHVYVYAWNNPIMLVDPSGHQPPPPAERWWTPLTSPVVRAIRGYRFAHQASERLRTDPGYRVSIDSPSAFGRDATSWLITQMKNNARGPVARTFREYLQGNVCHQVAAYMGWRAMVRGGAPWDFKPDIQLVGLRMSDPRNPRRRIYSVRMGDRLYRYDIAANVHFGYVGRASGFPSVELLAFAGIAQIGAGTSKWSYWPTQFDEPADAAAIRVGMELWDEHGLDFSEKDLTKALESYSPNLPKVFPGARLVESAYPW